LDLLLLAEGRHVLHLELYREFAWLWKGVRPQWTGGIVKGVVAFGAALVEKGEYAEAEPLLRLCLAIRREALSEEDWRIAEVMSVLGASLAGQNKFDEAEPLLLESYTQVKDSAETIPNALRNEQIGKALERIVNLYESWNKPRTAAKYRAALSEQESAGPAEPEAKSPP
jgi:hypothetical protein